LADHLHSLVLPLLDDIADRYNLDAGHSQHVAQQIRAAIPDTHESYADCIPCVLSLQ
jgi:hypothetical protein